MQMASRKAGRVIHALRAILLLVSCAAEVSWSDNLYSDFGSQMSIGDNPEFTSSGDINLASEFGSYPLSLYASLRYYF